MKILLCVAVFCLVGLSPWSASAAPDGKTVLIFSLTRGFRHKGAIAKGDPILADIARGLGCKAVISEDPAVFDPDKVGQWDCIVFNNCTGRMLLTDPKRRRAFMDRIKDGGAGFMGFHAATDCFYDWPEYGKMLNGYFTGHPWNQVCASRIEERDHPLMKPFGGKPFVIRDEIYNFRSYDRSKVRILMSIDPTSVDISGSKRADRDNAMCWIRQWGKGRVFYNAHGHYAQVFENAVFQKHIRLAMQWCLGRIDVPVEPRADDDMQRAGAHALERLRTATTDDARIAALLTLAWRPVSTALPAVVAEFGRNQEVASAAAAAADAICYADATLPKEHKIDVLEQALPLAANRNVRKALVHDLLKLGATDIPVTVPPGFLAHWHVAGPIPDPDGDLFGSACRPESGVDLAKGFQFRGKTYRWKKAVADDRGAVNLIETLGRRRKVGAYLYATVSVPTAGPAQVRLGSDDGFVLWVNGKRIGGKNVSRGLRPGADSFPIKLRHGENAVLLKVLQGAGDWAACVQLLDQAGKPLPVK